MKCTRCTNDKPATEFSRSKVNRNGRVSWCKQCHREHGREYAKNPVRRAKVRAAKMGVPFALAGHVRELQARIDAGVCELSGIPFDLHGGLTFASPSIDRITPALGYVYSNVRVICRAMNLALGEWGEEQLYAVVTAWLRKREGKGTSGQDVAPAETHDRQTPLVTV